mgnify:CR=1 FL=1
MGPAMNVGFIGLGAMGQHMARNLHRAGMLAGAWNRAADKAAALAAEPSRAMPPKAAPGSGTTVGGISTIPAGAKVTCSHCPTAADPAAMV